MKHGKNQVVLYIIYSLKNSSGFYSSVIRTWALCISCWNTRLGCTSSL